MELIPDSRRQEVSYLTVRFERNLLFPLNLFVTG